MIFLNVKKVLYFLYLQELEVYLFQFCNIK